MKKHSAGVALLVVLGILSACSGDTSTEPIGSGRTVPVGREYEIRVGEMVRLADSGALDVTLDRVFNDFRCPVDVVCPTAGTVDLELSASRPSGTIHSDIARFNGTQQGGVVRLHGYTFQIQRVLPARRSDQEIPQLDYRVFLISTVDRP